MAIIVGTFNNSEDTDNDTPKTNKKNLLRKKIRTCHRFLKKKDKFMEN